MVALSVKCNMQCNMQFVVDLSHEDLPLGETITENSMKDRDGTDWTTKKSMEQHVGEYGFVAYRQVNLPTVLLLIDENPIISLEGSESSMIIYQHPVALKPSSTRCR